jgi:hypothetical protein
MPGLPRKSTKNKFSKLLKKSGKSKSNNFYGATSINKNISTKERMITKFQDFVNEDFEEQDNELINSIREYLIVTYPSDWWNSEFQERVYDYVDMEEYVGDGDEDDDSTWEYEGPEDAYQNLCSGGAIEYDIIDEIRTDIKEKFHLNDEEYRKNDIGDIIENHMVNMIDWYDKLIFGESKNSATDPFGMRSNMNDMMSHWDIKYDTKNLPDSIHQDGRDIKL